MLRPYKAFENTTMCRHYLIYLLLALGFLLAGCAAPTRQPQRLRLINNSTHGIEKLTVVFPEERIAFGDVGPGARTDYQHVPKGVFRYAAYSFLINGLLVTQPVVDWVGEKPMEGDTFTYVVEFDPDRQFPEMIRLIEAIRE